MKIKVAVAPQANVPKPHSRAQTARNIVRAKATGASVIALTECWHARTRLVLFNQFSRKGWDTHAPRGSAVLAWDESVWELVSRWVVEGHSWIRNTSDARNIPAVQLKHIETGKIVDFYAVHPCPIPTLKAPEMVPAAKRAHVKFYTNLWQDIQHHARPAVVLGDWNSRGYPLGMQMDTRDIKYRNGIENKIIKVAHVDGKGRVWGSSTREEQDQPFSDHNLLIVERNLI